MISTSIFKALRFDSQTSVPARYSAADVQPAIPRLTGAWRPVAVA